MSLLLKLKIRVTPIVDAIQRLLDLSRNDNITIDDLDSEMRMLRQSYEQWSSLWTQVETSNPDDDTFEECVKVKTDFEGGYHDAMSKLYIQRARMARSTTPTTSSSTSTGASPVHRSKLKLPEVKLLTFKGDAGEWEAWWTSFHDMVDRHPETEISITAKYQLLLGALSGHPHDMVRSFPATSAGYQGALINLKSHYADPKQQLSRVTDKLLKLEFGDLNSDGVMDFKIKVEAILQTWDSMNVDTNHTLVTRLILSKLPETLRQQIYVLSNTVTPTKDNILECLKTVWERQDFDKISKALPAPKSKALPGPKTGTPDTPTKKRGCRFCNDSHSSSTCPVYPDAESRKARLADINACIICARAKHEDQCKPLTCYTCQGAHHTWLHPG